MIKRLIKKTKYIFSSCFACLGFLITIKEILIFFSVCNDTIQFVENLGIIGFIICLSICFLYGVIKNWPKQSFDTKIKNRDSTICLKIGNAFKNKGALIIPINDNLDIDLDGNTKGANSIQNQVIHKYYNGHKDELKLEIEKELNGLDLPLPIGSTLKINNRKKTFYLLVNSKKTKDNHVFSSEKDLTIALNGLWKFLINNGVKGEDITIPLINTQHSRNANITKENSAKQIINTFISISRTKKICENLIISIYPKDLDLVDYDNLCYYAKFLSNNYTDKVFD